MIGHREGDVGRILLLYTSSMNSTATNKCRKEAAPKDCYYFLLLTLNLNRPKRIFSVQ
jgi:hypothetical protein